MKYCGYTSFCAMFQARMFNTNFNVRISGEEKSNTKKMCASVALIFQCGRNNKILYVEMSDLWINAEKCSINTAIEWSAGIRNKKK